jgi:hypothetical protein
MKRQVAGFWRMIPALAAALLLASPLTFAQSDPLPSWNDTASKKAIVDFVELVTTAGSPGFIAPSERIATFDNDGTLWAGQPMLELLDYLRANEFKTYIVSGGGIEFIRPWAEHIYGVPPEQVVGSSIKSKYEVRGRAGHNVPLRSGVPLRSTDRITAAQWIEGTLYMCAERRPRSATGRRRKYTFPFHQCTFKRSRKTTHSVVRANQK